MICPKCGKRWGYIYLVDDGNGYFDEMSTEDWDDRKICDNCEFEL